MAWFARSTGSLRCGVAALRCMSNASAAAAAASPTAADAPKVLATVRGSLGHLVLNRPKALNALDLDMVQALRVASEWEDKVNVITMTGSGDKAFCAGGDVVLVAKSGSGKLGDNGDFARSFFAEEYRTDYMFATMAVPYVAIIDGITMGGGVGLSVHGKFRVATEKTVFAMPETAIGLFPDVGGGYFLPRLDGQLGNYLALTGHRLKGYDVFKAGIATHYVSSKKIPDLLRKLSEIKTRSTREVARVLQDFHETPQTSSTFEQHLGVIDLAFSASSVEEIFAFLESMAPRSKFCESTLASLKKMCPVSVKLTFQQLRRGRYMNLAEVLKMEYRMTQNVLAKPDFYEGIRALLIDKDQSPKWSHKSIYDVNDDEIEGFFERVGEDLEFSF